MAKKKPYVEEVKLELTGARVHVWITLKGKNPEGITDKLCNMSDRTLMRRIHEAWERTRVMDAGSVCFADIRVVR